MRSRGGCGALLKPPWHLRASTQAPGSPGQTLRVKVAVAAAPPGGLAARCPASRASWAGRTRRRTADCGAVCLFLTWVGTPWGSWASRPEPSASGKVQNFLPESAGEIGTSPDVRVLAQGKARPGRWEAWGRGVGGVGNGTFNEWHIKRGLSVAKACADAGIIAQRIESPPGIPKTLDSIPQHLLNLGWWYTGLSGVRVRKDQESRALPQPAPPTRVSRHHLTAGQLDKKLGSTGASLFLREGCDPESSQQALGVRALQLVRRTDCDRERQDLSQVTVARLTVFLVFHFLPTNRVYDIM